MSTSPPSRKFLPGPGWLLFIGMIALLLFNKNSRDVVKMLKEQVKVQSQRMNADMDGLKAALEKKREEGR